MMRPDLSSHSRAEQGGFTLLEVMVALTITGMVLGSIFGIIGGNKRLAWRSEQVLKESIEARNLINYAQLLDERGDLALDMNSALRLVVGEELEPPQRKTEASPLTLKHWEIRDASGELLAEGSHWVDLELLRL